MEEKTNEELVELLKSAGDSNLIPERLVAAVIESLDLLQAEIAILKKGVTIERMIDLPPSGCTLKCCECDELKAAMAKGVCLICGRPGGTGKASGEAGGRDDD